MKEKIIKYLIENLNAETYKHTLGVAKKAVELAGIYDADTDKAEITALLHDVARNIPDEKLLRFIDDKHIIVDDFTRNTPMLLHSYVGRYIAENQFNIHDKEILNAIEYHTTGNTKMGILAKIIYVADATEETRLYNGVESIRNESYMDLDKAIIMLLNSMDRYLATIGEVAHPDSAELKKKLLQSN